MSQGISWEYWCNNYDTAITHACTYRIIAQEVFSMQKMFLHVEPKWLRYRNEAVRQLSLLDNEQYEAFELRWHYINTEGGRYERSIGKKEI